MSDCLYGKLNSETIKKEYSAEETETVSLSVDNVKNKISARVKKTPGTLKITKSVNAGEQRTLVEFDGSENKEINLDEVDAYTGVENETSKTTVDTEHNTIDVEVKRTPGKIKFEKGGKILTDHLNSEVEFDGSEDITLHIPETSFETTETFETIYDETTNRVKGNVLKVPYTLTIVDENTGTQQMFDGGESFGDVTVNIPKFEGGINQLIGTEDNPVNFDTDMEIGNLYSVTGYVKTSPTSNMNWSSYNLVYRESKDWAICYNYLFGKSRLAMTRYNIGANGSNWQDWGTTIKLNNYAYDSSTPIAYAPTTSGIAGQILQSNGGNQAPTWIDLPETGIPKLVGTEEKPINLATDMEVGHLYVIEGYVIARADNNWLFDDVPILVFKHNARYLTFFDTYLHSPTSAAYKNGVESRLILQTGDTGYYSTIERYLSLTEINGYSTSPVGIYAPTSGGTAGQILQSKGASNAPTWFTPDYASQSYVDTQIANLVDSAPETLNTLNELATAIQEHKDILDAIGELPTVTRLI